MASGNGDSSNGWQDTFELHSPEDWHLPNNLSSASYTHLYGNGYVTNIGGIVASSEGSGESPS